MALFNICRAFPIGTMFFNFPLAYTIFHMTNYLVNVLSRTGQAGQVKLYIVGHNKILSSRLFIANGVIIM